LVAAHVDVDFGVLALVDAQQAVLRPERLHQGDSVGVDPHAGGFVDGQTLLSSRPPSMTWAWTWTTIWPAPAPGSETSRKCPSGCSAASVLASPIISVSRSGLPAASSTTSRYSCVLGLASRCTGACGLMSRIANTFSVSAMISDGISPL